MTVVTNMELYKIMQLLERKSLMAFLGEKPARDVLMAYEAAYGSVQKFAYERDVLRCVVDEYLTSGEEQQFIFCNCLEFAAPRKPSYYQEN